MRTVDKSTNNQKMFISLKDFAEFVGTYQYLVGMVIATTGRCTIPGYEGQLMPKTSTTGGMSRLARYWWIRLGAYSEIIDKLSLPIEKFNQPAHASLMNLE